MYRKMKRFDFKETSTVLENKSKESIEMRSFHTNLNVVVRWLSVEEQTNVCEVSEYFVDAASIRTVDYYSEWLMACFAMRFANRRTKNYHSRFESFSLSTINFKLL